MGAGAVEPHGVPDRPRPAQVPPVFAEWIVAFLSTRTPREVEDWAASDVSMVDVLRSAIPGGGALLPMAVRGMMGRQAVEAARAMGDGEFAALLGRIANSLPDHGTILYLYRDWYDREIRRLRDAIVG